MPWLTFQQTGPNIGLPIYQHTRGKDLTRFSATRFQRRREKTLFWRCPWVSLASTICRVTQYIRSQSHEILVPLKCCAVRNTLDIKKVPRTTSWNCRAFSVLPTWWCRADMHALLLMLRIGPESCTLFCYLKFLQIIQFKWRW